MDQGVRKQAEEEKQGRTMTWKTKKEVEEKVGKGG